MDFYVSALLAIAILTLFHLRPLHYGVLLPEMPGAEHVLLDGQVVPLVDKPPPQNLTRKVNLNFVEKIEAIYSQSQVSAGAESVPVPGASSFFCRCNRHPHGCLS